jgi:glycosyltransferase involved in cell wall biosynthesis
VLKILYVCHNHPANSPGGAEIYAYELYEAVRDAGEFAAVFVGRVGWPYSALEGHRDTRFALATEDPREYFLFTRFEEFDRLLWTSSDKKLYTEDWATFLRAVQPDVVHFQHSFLLGYDMIRETRNILPDVPIVYTLHEFIAICHNHGQMVRTETHELCNESSVRRCHQCFPAISMQNFFLRERFIKSALELVDMFVTPSDDARRRYLAWGIPPEKIRTENYGRFPVQPIVDPPDAGRRRRIGFFGQMTVHKGVDVLLEAMRILDRAKAGVQLRLFGVNLDIQPPAFQARIHELLEETAGAVEYAGSYTQRELPRLLSAVDWVIVPSVWWETGPLVIHEALMHRRPVICSNIGSMVERIDDGRNGLHFRVRDPQSLADTILKAVDSPELWDELRGRIVDPHPMDEHLEVMTGIYRELLARSTPRMAPV